MFRSCLARKHPLTSAATLRHGSYCMGRLVTGKHRRVLLFVPETCTTCISMYDCGNFRGGPMAAIDQPGLVADSQARLRNNTIAEDAKRNVSLDAYRGFVMLLMMAEVLQLSRVAAAYPTSLFWKVLAFNQTHVEWFGCSLHDTIQPGFSFLVGVAVPYSIASRIAKGGTFGRMFLHALWRALVLFLLAFQPPRRQWIGLGVILTGYWLLWAFYPAPTWAAHWAKEMNAGVAF